MFERQNHSEALNYLKAAMYAGKTYRYIEYFVISFSVVLCFAGIFNRYLPRMINRENAADIQQTVSQWVNVISAVFIISQIFLSTLTRRTWRLSVNLMERYDCYVYDIPLNKAMLISVTPGDVEIMAQKLKRRPEQYLNYHFAAPEDASAKNAGWSNQYRILKEEYRLMSYVKRVFYTGWIGFILLIFLTAVFFDDKFINTLANTLIPSLSVITLIISSFSVFGEAMWRLQNAISQMESQEVNLKKLADLDGRFTNVTRLNQDALFQIRLSEFNIPDFFRKLLKRKFSEEPDLSQTKGDEGSNTFSPVFKKTAKSTTVKENAPAKETPLLKEVPKEIPSSKENATPKETLSVKEPRAVKAAPKESRKIFVKSEKTDKK